ncbi:MAG: hypothetical protein KDA88_15285 [Planctomycetaceae bacterium]|nr:hypothetical protein [Planctomycetaceae bacterium]MCB9951764.1 hypothetical protein [Planctomycetaceae bacterium]
MRYTHTLLAVLAMSVAAQAQDLGSLLDTIGVQRTDGDFNGFISPMTNPVFFEDPRNLTEARIIFANQNVPGALGGGNAQLYAMQLRAALTEDLSFIATKDGFIVSDNPLINDGWADLSAGLKYNLYEDYEYQEILSAGVTYEIPLGSGQALQGNGDGEFHVFMTGGKELLPGMHLLAATGFRLPVDNRAESTSMYLSTHLDQQIGETGFYVFTEANYYHWLAAGKALPLPVEGGDLFNLGSSGVSDNNIITGAIGVKYKLTDTSELGFAWEAPLTGRQDILASRATVDLILRY